MRRRYSYQSCHDSSGGRWQIIDHSRPGDREMDWNGAPVWEMPYLLEHADLDEPPAELRAEFERLLAMESPEASRSPLNIVEIVADGDDSAFDQPCTHGHRVEDHAVYCHNENWLYAPRKCRRSWYTGGEVRDEDCPGYAPNPRRPAAGAI